MQIYAYWLETDKNHRPLAKPDSIPKRCQFYCNELGRWFKEEDEPKWWTWRVRRWPAQRTAAVEESRQAYELYKSRNKERYASKDNS